MDKLFTIQNGPLVDRIQSIQILTVSHCIEKNDQNTVAWPLEAEGQTTTLLKKYFVLLLLYLWMFLWQEYRSTPNANRHSPGVKNTILRE